ncbi:MAG: aminomethyl-transferring glycine dehydrogenase subunit GcvPA [Parachlamydiaceae bacterium]|nr:aminomethyl-transferring glycine dehydrogenase subunit GcvPA [Parachlamydiaceae bacterium]
MDFISNQENQINAMLKVIGVENIDALFSAVPQNLRLSSPDEDDGLSEFEGMQLLKEIAAKNTYPAFTNYLGAGSYEHHVPAIVGATCAKSEFLTAYTPYQAETSQGMLQIIFEFQSAICALTGMDVSNASLYDGASACAEALLMALRLNKGRNKVLIAKSMHPHYRAVCEQYLRSHQTEIKIVPFDLEGKIDKANLLSSIDDQTAAVLIQSPNFFGILEDLHPIVTAAKKHQAFTIQCGNPLAYGLYACPGESEIDIAVGDMQPIGLPLQFGGPYAGYLACRQDLVRQMPGRIVGETKDSEGRRGFVLTLQAREQHIRREKATSNICTNQALAALASLVAMLWYGPVGLQKLSLTNFQRTAYLKEKLAILPKVKLMAKAPFFNEFAVNFGRPVNIVQQHFRKNNIEPGLDLSRFYPQLEGYFIIAVTETKSKEQLDQYVQIAQELLEGVEVIS